MAHTGVRGYRTCLDVNTLEVTLLTTKMHKKPKKYDCIFGQLTSALWAPLKVLG